MQVDQLGVLIPIIAVTLGLTIPIVALVVNYLRRRALIEALGRERLAHIERGTPPPPWPEGLMADQEEDVKPRTPLQFAQARQAQLKTALVTLGVGLAILFGLPPMIGDDVARVGIIPIAVGAALLLAWALQGRSKLPAADQTDPPR